MVLVALPIGAVAFAMGAGNALREIGKGDFSIEQEMPQRGGSGAAPVVPAAVREEEIRQMVEARSYRRVARGEEALDVDAEVERAAEAGGRLGRPCPRRGPCARRSGNWSIARNERRKRQGKRALNVEKEIERQLSELENLGQ